MAFPLTTLTKVAYFSALFPNLLLYSFKNKNSFFSDASTFGNGSGCCCGAFTKIC
ncbi:MAG: hypothetical protein ACM3VV_03775 [Deltaproteobacteria bacterium]